MEKDDFIYWARKMYDRGLMPSTSGNISMLSDDDNIFITASGSASGDLWMDDIVKINMEGELLEGVKKPSSEKLMHVEIYKIRPDIRAIIHSHSPEITSFAVCGLPLNEALMPEFVYQFGNVPVAKYELPGSIELAHKVKEQFILHNAVLMENHGIVVGGKNLKEAFYALETLQAYCKTYLCTEILGERKTLTKKQIKAIEGLKRSY